MVVFFFSIKPYNSPGYNMDAKPIAGGEAGTPAWQGRSIAGPKLRLVEFSAFLEQQRDPESVSCHEHNKTKIHDILIYEL